jgi:hypothetical protein
MSCVRGGRKPQLEIRSLLNARGARESTVDKPQAAVR